MYDLAEAANETYDEDAGLDPTLMGDDDFAGPPHIRKSRHT